MNKEGIGWCLLLLVVFACLSVPCWSAEMKLPIYSANRVVKAPVIDGVLNDSCWASAEKTAVFVNIDGTPVKVETRGMVCYDRDRIYIAIECKEPEMASLKKNLASGNVRPWEESVELFFDVNADQRDYMQLRVGVLGEKDMALTDIVGVPQLIPLWDGKAHVGDDGWTVEASVPLSVLGGKIDQKSYWGMNLNRARSIGTGGWLCWSATYGWFHNSSKFGRLIFAPYSEWLQNYFTRLLTDRSNQLKTLAKAYPSAVGSIAQELESIQKANTDFVNEVKRANPQNSSDCQVFADKGEAALAQADQVLSSIRLRVIEQQFGVSE